MAVVREEELKTKTLITSKQPKLLLIEDEKLLFNFQKQITALLIE